MVGVVRDRRAVPAPRSGGSPPHRHRRRRGRDRLRRVRQPGRTRSSPCGRCGLRTRCGPRSPTRAFERSTFGPRATEPRGSNSRALPSIPSSMSTHPTTWRKPSAWPSAWTDLRSGCRDELRRRGGGCLGVPPPATCDTRVECTDHEHDDEKRASVGGLEPNPDISVRQPSLSHPLNHLKELWARVTVGMRIAAHPPRRSGRGR